MMRYADVTERLRAAYDKSSRDRDRAGKTEWKVAERKAFVDRLRSEGASALLEIGAGTGHDSAFFASEGLSVVATDLSPEMVARCREKGLDAHVADFLTLPSGPFDAVFALNCLLHVPSSEIDNVLRAIVHVLRPGGLFLLGVYGGEEFEGISPADWHDPPRFFCFRTDDELRRLAERHFDVVDFHVVEVDGDAAVARGAAGKGVRFQSMTLRKRVT